MTGKLIVWVKNDWKVDSYGNRMTGKLTDMEIEWTGKLTDVGQERTGKLTDWLTD